MTIGAKRPSFTRINRDIRVAQIRLVDADGHQVGIVDTHQGLERAEQADLDLVEIAPDAKPPVCRIMDFGKYRYDKEKKAKEARKKQHQVQMKGIRLGGPNISAHDIEYRMGHIREFIGRGNRVKVSMRFKGRQMAYKEHGRAVLDDLAHRLGDIAVLDQAPRMEGREMSMILRPI
jgi:translation initiation factor IF-3